MISAMILRERRYTGASLLILLLTGLTLETAGASPPQNNYTVTNGDTTCIVMTAGIQLTIPYPGQTQNFSQTIDVDSNATNTGICDSSKTSETLEIHFNTGWNLTFVFSNYKDKHTNVTYFYTDQINFAYTLDADHFPHLDNSTTDIKVYTHLDNDTLSASINGSYQCQTNQTLGLNNGIILTFFNMQCRAFGSGNSSWFSDSEISVCPVEGMYIPETDVKVAVTVGIALGVLLVATIVVYCIVSKAKGKDNEADTVSF